MKISATFRKLKRGLVSLTEKNINGQKSVNIEGSVMAFCILSDDALYFLSSLIHFTVKIYRMACFQVALLFMPEP